MPIFCIYARYNLIVGRVCSASAGQFWGAIFPWLISWVFYQGQSIRELLTWSGLVLNGFVDFLCPLVAALAAIRATRYLGDDGSTTLRQTTVHAIPTRLLPQYHLIVVVLLVLLCIAVGGALLHKIAEVLPPAVDVTTEGIAGRG